jgi:putative salt-induced outer membrane protein YdiY
MARLSWCLVFLFLSLGTARGDTLKLANGDTLTGEIVEWAVSYVVIDHPQLGRVHLGLDQLAVETGKPPSKGLFGTRFLAGWKRKISIGFNGRSGNATLRNLTAGADFGYEDPFKRWRIDGRYYYNEDDDGVTDNNAIVNARRDWLFPGSRWFARASTRYQYDEFEAWLHRLTLFAGPGYNLVHREEHSLDLAFGPSFTKEFGDVQDNKGELLFSVDYEWKPATRYEFSFTNQTFVETVPSAGHIRNLTIANFAISLLEEPALSFNVGGQNEYETHPAEGDENNDIKYYMALGLDF